MNRIKKNKYLNESGISLIEVIASIVILTIILISFSRFFLQMGLTNNINDDKQDAYNLAQKELNYWKKTFEDLNEFPTFLSDPIATYSSINPEDIVTEDGNFISIERSSTITTTSNFKEIIQISKNPDLITTPTKAVQIHIKILNNNNSIISETYGYVFYKG